MKKLPIAIVANAQISYHSMGGSDKIFLEMAKVWKAAGHSLKVFGCSEAGKMCVEAGLSENFQRISGFDVEKIGLFLAYFLRTISSLFTSVRIKEGILYSSSDFWPDLIFALRQKFMNRKIKWVAGIFLIAPSPFKVKYALNLRGVLYWLTQRISVAVIRSFADLIVVLCQEDKDFLSKSGVCEDKIIIISAGLDFDVIEKIPQQDKKYDACFVGRFHAQKGLSELIHIWKRVVLEIPLAKLAVIGWGNRRWVDLVNSLISKNNLRNNISLLGFLDNEEKYKVIKSSRVFLFTSSYESWGIVVAEALGCSCPVVAFNIDATRKFKKGVVLVDPDDLDSFAREIINLIRDDVRYSTFTLEAGDYAKDFTWEKSAQAVVESVVGINV